MPFRANWEGYFDTDYPLLPGQGRSLGYFLGHMDGGGPCFVAFSVMRDRRSPARFIDLRSSPWFRLIGETG
ncbi:MAG: hypothetical protein V3R66_00440 [Rhodospirillales bacterium]